MYVLYTAHMNRYPILPSPIVFLGGGGSPTTCTCILHYLLSADRAVAVLITDRADPDRWISLGLDNSVTILKTLFTPTNLTKVHLFMTEAHMTLVYIHMTGIVLYRLTNILCTDYI